MDSMESQMRTLIHKVDTLYERIEQINQNIALIFLSQSEETKNHNGTLPELDIRISDYSSTAEILEGHQEYKNTYMTDDRQLDPDLTEMNLSSPIEISQVYLEYELCCPSGETMERSLIHQDVLGNEDYLEDIVECDPPEITEDIQIRRLTAQLTAAYNRIAALEEQLVLKKMKA
jgi:hypothetical protein